MSKILVTGGAGFVGSNLVRELIRMQHEVFVVDDLSSGHEVLVDAKARFVRGSIIDDQVLDTCFAFKPEYVFHLAALFANQNSVDHPDVDLNVNGLGTIKILDRCTKSMVKKVLYVSSSCVYGGMEVMDESTEAYYPDTPYAITKLLGEQYAKFWAHHHKLDVVMVRLFNTYGPGEYPGKYRNVIPNFIRMAMDGKPLPITGTGTETRDFTFVDDTVLGICRAMFATTQPGDVFNLATGVETRILDIANEINRCTGNSAGVEFLPRRSWDAVTRRVARTGKAKEILGFTAQRGITQGIGETCKWVSEALARTTSA